MTVDETEMDKSLQMPNNKDVINISALRLMYIYLLMCQSEQVCLEDLNTHLLNHPLIQRTLTKETLNKYLYTLQLFGCRIHRYEAQNHPIYRLDDHPLKMQCTPEELKSLQVVTGLLEQQPIATVYRQFCRLLRRLCKSTYTSVPTTDADLGLDNFTLAKRFSKATITLIETLQKYCFEGQTLEICYKAPDKQTAMVIVEPQEVIYHKKQLFLVGTDPKTNRKIRFNLKYIHSHRQLPSRIRTASVKTLVTFKLTGRVALNYRPYPGEVVMNKDEFLLVKHETDEVEQLIRRLMKYGPDCQIVSPHSVRQEMLQVIEHLMSALEAPVEEVQQQLLSKAQTDETLRKWVYYCDIPQTGDGAKGD